MERFQHLAILIGTTPQYPYPPTYTIELIRYTKYDTMV